MSDETKTFVFPDTAKANSLDPNLLLAMNNGNGGFGGNNWWVILFLWAIFGRNGFGNGFGGNGNYNTDFIGSQLSNAIQGNANAISNLATHLDCSIGQVQNGLNAIQTSIANVGNQVGMSTAQVVNAVQSGNCAIQNQIAQCCCEVRERITRSNYENQIATLNQTNQLGGKIDANTASISSQIANQTTAINEHFCSLEKRELQNRIEALREQNTQLQGQISNANQTAQVAQLIAQATNPITASLAGLRSEVDGIKCKLPETATIPYSPVVGIPTCSAYNLGLYGGAYGFNNNGGFL